MKDIFKKNLIFYLLFLFTHQFVLADDSNISENTNRRFVKVYLPASEEEHRVELRRHQTATVFVYLASLGDPLDKYMVSIVSDKDNKLIANSLSGSEGIIIFKKINAGSYTVFVNRRVVRDEVLSTVKIGDIRLKAVP
jgi:hypothetical protein